MNLRGVRTTLSSRAWTSLYAAARTTADYAQKLMDLGAVIVGKTKVSQFASGEKWVDAQAPWNPRADQYQDPSGSSAGAGVALAGYEWLEYAVGEDGMWDRLPVCVVCTNSTYQPLMGCAARPPAMECTRCVLRSRTTH
jgi:Asp-tRNA(Asn)/Glu-tRNA(Gln) amidotransferase A subunit family amidase